MKLEKLYIKGFRNFKETTVKFNNQSCKHPTPILAV